MDAGVRTTPGAVVEGVKSQEWLKLNPHPNLPPARGKVHLVIVFSKSAEN